MDPNQTSEQRHDELVAEVNSAMEPGPARIDVGHLAQLTMMVLAAPLGSVANRQYEERADPDSNDPIGVAMDMASDIYSSAFSKFTDYDGSLAKMAVERVRKSIELAVKNTDGLSQKIQKKMTEVGISPDDIMAMIGGDGVQEVGTVSADFGDDGDAPTGAEVGDAIASGLSELLKGKGIKGKIQVHQMTKEQFEAMKDANEDNETKPDSLDDLP